MRFVEPNPADGREAAGRRLRSGLHKQADDTPPPDPYRSWSRYRIPLRLDRHASTAPPLSCEQPREQVIVGGVGQPGGGVLKQRDQVQSGEPEGGAPMMTGLEREGSIHVLDGALL